MADIKKMVEEEEKYELYKTSKKSKGLAVALGILLSPFSYVYVGKYWL